MQLFSSIGSKPRDASSRKSRENPRAMFSCLPRSSSVSHGLKSAQKVVMSRSNRNESPSTAMAGVLQRRIRAFRWERIETKQFSNTCCACSCRPVGTKVKQHHVNELLVSNKASLFSMARTFPKMRTVVTWRNNKIASSYSMFSRFLTCQLVLQAHADWNHEQLGEASPK